MAIFAPSVVDQVSAALSARSLLHEAIASNIANRDAQGYQRLQVRFDAAMAQGRAPTVQAERTREPVSLEQDLVALSANAAQYQALARTLSRYFSIINAITAANRG